ncbi:MAG: hypothetical protein GC158_03435 [Cyanobacteria bacterium RI_101]|nr:hypothetical protein [Cyanobacteria bacterium RI_101]
MSALATLVKGGHLRYANLYKALLGAIHGKLLEIMQKWGDIPKVFRYCYCRECYTESFSLIPS